MAALFCQRVLMVRWWYWGLRRRLDRATCNGSSIRLRELWNCGTMSLIGQGMFVIWPTAMKYILWICHRYMGIQDRLDGIGCFVPFFLDPHSAAAPAASCMLHIGAPHQSLRLKSLYDDHEPLGNSYGFVWNTCVTGDASWSTFFPTKIAIIRVYIYTCIYIYIHISIYTYFYICV